MSDLLAKCDWHGDELSVELPQWPEVVTVWVNGKAMPYVPVVNDSKCDTCEAMLDCDECVRADASHKELRGLQAENEKLRELARGLQYCAKEAYGMCARVPVGGSRPFTCCPLYDFDAKVYRCERLRLELGIGVDQ